MPTIFYPYAAFRALIDKVLRPERGDRVGVQNVVLIITDGKSTYDSDKTIPYAEEARNLGARILAVGITIEVRVCFLNCNAEIQKSVIAELHGNDFSNRFCDLVADFQILYAAV